MYAVASLLEVVDHGAARGVIIHNLDMNLHSVHTSDPGQAYNPSRR